MRQPCWVIEVDLPGGRTGLGPLLYLEEKEAKEDADFIGGTVVPVEWIEICRADCTLPVGPCNVI